MKVNLKKVSIVQIFRFVVQIVFFIILPGLFINAFSGLKLVYIAIINGNFSIKNNLFQLVEFITIIPVTILMGRFFCGWMCAFGTISDIIYSISKKLFKINFKINEKTDKILKYLKFVILAFIITVIWSLGVSAFNAIDPWNVFGILAKVDKLPNISYVLSEFPLGFFILLVIIAASIFIERFFCRYLCPMGAVFTIVSKLKLVKIKKPSGKCGACRLCSKSCIMGIPLYTCNKINSGECINCYKCITVCPRKNVSMNIANEDIRSGVAAAVAVTTITGFYYVGSFVAKEIGSNVNNNTSTVSSNTTSNKAAYVDGTYQGSGTGFRGGTTKVSVTVKNKSISNIEAISYEDDAPYFDRAYNSVVAEILNAQTTDVDTVSGATYSSNGIMEAVANALKDVKLSKSSSTSQKSAATSTPSTSESTDTSTSIVSNNDTENKLDNSTETSEASLKYKDGTYEGSANGFRRGITTVSINVKNDKINEVTIVSNNDDAPYFNRALNTVISQIIKKQTSKVDVVSGATYSSMGIMNAVADALIKAEL